MRFIGKEELDINLITLDFLEDFKSFLNKEREIRTKRLKMCIRDRDLPGLSGGGIHRAPEWRIWVLPGNRSA